MALKEYVCPRWPNYSIGGYAKFRNGRFSTDDPAVAAIVESNDMFGVFIWDITGEAHKPKPEDKAPVEVVRAGLRTGPTIATALREVSKNDSKGREGRLPVAQQKGPDKGPRAGKVKPGRSSAKGREAGPVLQELEEIVRGSGIIGVES